MSHVLYIDAHGRIPLEDQLEELSKFPMPEKKRAREIASFLTAMKIIDGLPPHLIEKEAVMLLDGVFARQVAKRESIVIFIKGHHVAQVRIYFSSPSDVAKNELTALKAEYQEWVLRNGLS